MKNFNQELRRLVLPLLLALSTAGCVIAAGGKDAQPTNRGGTETSGATYCQQSDDGRMVACGGKATYCQQSSDGNMVACGGLATYCQKSSNGKSVACGGLAAHCQRSDDGKQVACGGGR
ncbi:hypothetical protein [Massilia horti]|uniref:Lipoprotein n=1 Tax=Massilia horti TaxID=2562153 RepID=A0A4Y9SLP1_9BURK|nr:hypothetical protein [Massilia horti]TFW27580.1 hypothetical protein E4O92_23515 [Massilia horti]